MKKANNSPKKLAESAKANEAVKRGTEAKRGQAVPAPADPWSEYTTDKPTADGTYLNSYAKTDPDDEADELIRRDGRWYRGDLPIETDGGWWKRAPAG